MDIWQQIITPTKLETVNEVINHRYLPVICVSKLQTLKLVNIW